MRILIVDDEVIIRTGLATVIPWYELGIELLEPAASAEEAMQRLSAESPHLLMTDIRMTGRTGLELAEEACRLLPELEVIILSGYDDFAYAQQAIRQNVTDYLLKTSPPEEIIKTVLRAKRRIEQRLEQHNLHRELEKSGNEQQFRSLVIEGKETNDNEVQVINNLLSTGNHSASNLQSDNKQEMEQKGWHAAVIQASGWGSSRSEIRLLTFAVHNMLQDLIGQPGCIEQEKVVIIAAPEYPLPPERYWQSLLERISQQLKCRLRIGIGNPVRATSSLHQSYKEAEQALAYQSLLPEQSIYCYDKFHSRTGGRTICTHEEELCLSSILLKNDTLSLQRWTQDWIGDLAEDAQATPMSVQSAVQSAMLAGGRWLERSIPAEGYETDLTLRSVELPEIKSSNERSLSELLFDYLYKVARLYHTRYAEGSSTHVNRTLAYIEQHLSRDTSLAAAARHIHLHPGHLSEIFKKETGITYSDFVLQKKMEHAAEILTVTTLKVAEVAGKVGYDDVKYFSRLFKKYNGYTPSEYREHLLDKHYI